MVVIPSRSQRIGAPKRTQMINKGIIFDGIT